MTRILLAALLASAAAPLAAQQGMAVSVPAPGASAAFRALAEEEWAWRQGQLGRVKQDGRWQDGGPDLPHVDAATHARQLAYWNDVLKRLDAIPLDRMSEEERIDAAVYRQSVETLAADARFRTYEAPFNADTFFWTDFVPRAGGFADARAYRNFISRMRQIPRLFDEHIANMRVGLKRGYSVPKVSLVGRDKSIEPYTEAGDDNPFFGPLKAMPSSIPAAEQEQLRAEARAAIRQAIVPAYAKLLGFIRADYAKQARDTLAAEKMPDGPAFYQAQIRGFTTLDLTAEQIHQMGLAEVARIRAEMEQVKAKTGFKGDFNAFTNFMRTDPRFYAKTPAELMGFAAYVVKRADAHIADMIGVFPRRKFTVRPVPAALAPFYTGGRGGLESCLFNTYDLPSRPLYTLTSLALHECNPGHSFHATVMAEQQGRPDFRRQTGFSGYGEGWALYMEWLGTKMGMYETPYDDFGRLTYEMWRAARLAIDTGIHHYGWSREKAQAFLRDNTALSNHEVVTEIDRYIAWPGQALAYKLGEMLIRQKRAEAEARLGPAFDQRNFHRVILSLGSVPLPVLEARLDRFIADGGKGPPPSPLYGAWSAAEAPD